LGKSLAIVCVRSAAGIDPQSKLNDVMGTGERGLSGIAHPSK
jgi:hypothetical protein